MRLDDCVDNALQQLTADVRARFASDPIATMQIELGLSVQAVESLTNARADGGACDGVSFLQEGVVLYAPTANSRRENFTLAHELGHWLVEQTPGAYDWIADQVDAGRILETVCDGIAQRLLIPDSVAADVVNGTPLRAQHVLDLYAVTQASRPACAIALSKLLPGLGAVALIDRYSATVSHSSVSPHPEFGWPTVFPWRGQVLSDTHPLMLLPDGDTRSSRLPWSTLWGTKADFYINAVSEGARVIAVFSDTDLWNVEQFHAKGAREFDIRPLLSGYCCGTPFEVRGYSCTSCRQPFCPKCKHCKCQREVKREAPCTSCFLQFQPHLVENGLCLECRS